MSVAVIPLAYMEMIFSSTSWLMLVWFFFRITGSNAPFRSRGTWMGVAAAGPQRFTAVAVPAVVHFSIRPVFHEFRDGLTKQLLDIFRSRLPVPAVP